MSARQLAVTWSEWLSEARGLVNALEDQAEALVGRDAVRVSALEEQLEQRRERLSSVDHRARQTSLDLAEKLKSGPSFADLAPRLNPNDSSVLLALSRDIETTTDLLRAAMIRNHALIENELAYVTGTLGLIGQALREPSTPYGPGDVPALTLDRTA